MQTVSNSHDFTERAIATLTVATCVLSVVLQLACASSEGETVVAETEAEAAPAEEVAPAPSNAAHKSAPMRQAAPHAYLAGSVATYDLPEAPPFPPPTSREGYDPIEERPFVSVGDEPLSTFSIDVDTASYANLRRFLNDDMLPVRDAVRIEELINYFDYADPAPRPGDEHPFLVTTELTSTPWQPDHRLLRIGLQGLRIDASELPPQNLVFLLDVSGSMNRPDKLPLLQKSLRMLVKEMRPEDRVAIVVYAGAAGLVLPSTSCADKEKIVQALDQLRAGGSTAGGAGLALAYRVARESLAAEGNNRVILATDGDFNVGPSSDAEMVELIEQERKSGVFLTVLGFGTGNWQDAKMEKLSNAGNGNFAYVDSLLEARKVLVNEMGGTLQTIAKDVKLQIEFNPTHVAAYRLLGDENRALASRDFDDDAKDAGDLGAGHSVTAFYEVVPATKAGDAGAIPLRYQRRDLTGAAASNEIATVKLRYKRPAEDESILLTRRVDNAAVPLQDASESLRFGSAVAEFGLVLRDSPHKGEASLDAVKDRARSAVGDDEFGYRTEFLTLVERARALRDMAKVADTTG